MPFNQIKQNMIQLSDNPKIQGAGATFTTTSGMLTVLEIIPGALGVVATMMGMILTWVMISKVRLDKKKRKLEIRLMEKEHVCEKCKENRRHHSESE